MSEIAARTGEQTFHWGRGGKAALALGALVVLADFLFWDAEPGISFALFFLAAGIAVLLLRRQATNRRSLAIAGAVFLLGLVPILEALSWFSLLSGLFGVSILALAASGRLPRLLEDLPGVLARFGVLAPFRFVADGVNFLAVGTGKGLAGRITRALLVWIIPAIFAVAFLLLFASANPLIESALNAIRFESAMDLLQPWRIMLWGFVAVIAWPLLMPRLLRWRKVAEIQGPVRPRAEGLIFGRAAILRSLIVFNALFAVQSVSDLAYLWGGVRLPEGLSYADYAHRGAYPLIVTALLAAGFVLAAMRKNGAAQGSQLIRGLVYLWIGQNVLLVVSSILRLDLYVNIYSLTEMRIAAGIWMGLVAAGLLLILLRIFLRRSNKWLITMNLMTLGLTLYACGFLDFSAMIAKFNVEHSREVGGEGVQLDFYYMSDLGPAAIPALDLYLKTAKGRADSEMRDFDLMRGNAAFDFMLRQRDWRSWSFRDARLEAYLMGDPDFAKSAREAMNSALSTPRP